jgi:hypothetical protein
MRQIPYVSLRNSKQMARKLKLADGQRTEMAANVRTDDGLTNGASNIIKLIQLRDDINHLVLFGSSLTVKNLYFRGIESTWTPIKPVTTQFAVGKTKSAQVVRKQFPLRPASAKTVHRSQSDITSHK